MEHRDMRRRRHVQSLREQFAMKRRLEEILDESPGIISPGWSAELKRRLQSSAPMQPFRAPRTSM